MSAGAPGPGKCDNPGLQMTPREHHRYFARPLTGREAFLIFSWNEAADAASDERL